MSNKVYLLAVLLALLSACAGHWHTATPLNHCLGHLYVDIEHPNFSLVRALNQQMRMHHLTPVERANQAPLHLTIHRADFSYRPLTTDLSNQARVYMARYQLNFSVKKRHFKPTIQSQRMIIYRHVTINPNQTLYSTDERETIKHEMETALAQHLLYRLCALNHAH